MIRKTLLAIAATAALGTTLLAPTAASAWGYKHHHHHRHHFRPFVGYNAFVVNDYVDSCVLKKRWVSTPYGMVKKWVKVCY